MLQSVVQSVVLYFYAKCLLRPALKTLQVLCFPGSKLTEIALGFWRNSCSYSCSDRLIPVRGEQAPEVSEQPGLVCILVLPLPSSMPVANDLNPSVPPFPSLQNGANNIICL